MLRRSLHARTVNNGMRRVYYEIETHDGIFEMSDQFAGLDTDIYPGETVCTFLVLNRPAKRGVYRVRYGIYSDNEKYPMGPFDEIMLVK